MDVNLFKTQTTSDRMLEEISKLLEVPRNALNVFASPKGLLIGPLSFKCNDVIVRNPSTPYLINPQSTYSGL